jgi:hypothetical protein
VGPILAKRLKGKTMTEKAGYSEQDILQIIDRVDREDFVLANIARMVYYAGFRENEILNIKIRHVLENDGLVSEIQPFMEKSTRAYTEMPIVLKEPAKSHLAVHIDKLRRNGYITNQDLPLFPDKKTGKAYKSRTLISRFQDLFEGITLNRLRQLGEQRMEKELRSELSDESSVAEELKKFARHSRKGTTERHIKGKGDKAGKRKKRYLPWEEIVRLVEEFVSVHDADDRMNRSKEIEAKISELGDQEVAASLKRLLLEYESRPSRSALEKESPHESLGTMIKRGNLDAVKGQDGRG